MTQSSGAVGSHAHARVLSTHSFCPAASLEPPIAPHHVSTGASEARRGGPCREGEGGLAPWPSVVRVLFPLVLQGKGRGRGGNQRAFEKQQRISLSNSPRRFHRQSRQSPRKMSAVKQNTAIVAASVVGGVALGSLLVRAALRPVLRSRATTFIKKMLAEADIIVGRDIIVHDDSIFLDWVNRGMLAIGESYMVKKWEAVTPLDVVLTRLLSLPADSKRKLFKAWNSKLIALGAHIFNYQSPSRAGIVGAHHYDIGNDFFKLWLDPYMQYSCAYYKGVDDVMDLDKAQQNKLHLIAQKLKLEPGMRVLEIGCGWGGLACFLAKNYGVHVTGITISNEQLKGAREWAVREGVSHLTSFEYCDYRKMDRQFDRVVSIAMVEAVGYKNLDEYYSVIARCLKDGGLSVVHGIAANRSLKVPNQLWILKYIFPNGFLPSTAQALLFAERKMVVEDVHNLGPDYDKTLMCWNARFQEHVKNGTIQRSDVFKRMWEYYLMYCAAGFRARTIQLCQVVYSKNRAERYDTFR